MRLATVVDGHESHPVAVMDERWMIPMDKLDPSLSGDVMSVLSHHSSASLAELVARAPRELFLDAAGAVYTAPYLFPRKIIGIGLNYSDHAADLGADVPDEPASFIKGAHTIVGADGAISIPRESGRITAEAEVGVVIGRSCWEVEPAQALEYVWGLVPILDQTAEDILLRNPRYLTRAKNFPSFFAFGPQIISLDEILGRVENLNDIQVATCLNGQEVRTNSLAHMMFDIPSLISLQSKVMPLFPGDIISTGTPGAVRISAGDVVGCRVTEVGELLSHVI